MRLKTKFPLHLLAFLLVFGTFIILVAYSTEPPTGKTGAIFDSDCTSCHANPNSTFDGNISIEGLPSIVEFGTTYPLKVTVSKSAGSPLKTGFELVIVDDDNNTLGAIQKVDQDLTVRTLNGRSYLSHSNARDFVTGVPISWNFNWTAPSTGNIDAMKIYSSAILGDGVGVSNDKMLTNSISVPFSGTNKLAVILEEKENVSCNGLNDGMINLNAIGGNSPYTYSWSNGMTGESNFNLEPGNYTITVTDINGDIAIKNIDVIEPINMEVAFDGTPEINCSNSEAEVSAYGIGGNVDESYLWSTGSTSSSIFTASTGAYSVTITDTKGCTASSTVQVVENYKVPNIVSNSGVLGCENDEVQLYAFADNFAPVYTYSSWQGPNGFSEYGDSIQVSDPGIYSVTVTGGNGCTSQSSIVVTEDYSYPANVSALGDTIKCDGNDVFLYGYSDSDNVEFIWEGPANFSAEGNKVQVNVPGVYYLKAQKANGCSISLSVEIYADESSLPSISAGGGTLSCNNSTLTLSGASLSSNVTYEWIGTNGFYSTELTPVVTEPGEYTFIVTDFVTGCSNSKTVEVVENTNVPSIYLKEIPFMDCGGSSVSLVIQNPKETTLYSWTGPNDFSIDGDSIFISSIGTYAVTAYDLQTGCTGTKTFEIGSEEGIALCQYLGQFELTCSKPTVVLDAHNSETNLTYLWEGPDGYSSVDANPSVDVPGEYTVNISNPTGCGCTQKFEVKDNINPPAVSISSVEEASCGSVSDGKVNLNIVGGKSPYFFSPFYDYNAMKSGDYYVTITDINGCSSEFEFTIGGPTEVIVNDVDIFNVSDSGSNGGIDLSLTGGNAPYNYQWLSNGNVISTDDDLTNVGIGTYSVLVSDQTGCEYEFGPYEVQVSTGIDDKNSLKVSVYPNAIGELVLEMDNQIGNSQLELYDMTGRVMLKKELNSNKEKIDLHPLKKGVYILTVRQKGKLFHTKIIRN